MAHVHGYHDEGAAAASMASWAVALLVIVVLAALFIGLLLWAPWRFSTTSPAAPGTTPGIQQPAPAPGAPGQTAPQGSLIGNTLYI